MIEIVEYVLLYTCFLGGAWLLREEGHVKLDVLLSRLNPRNQALLNAVTSGLAAMLWLLLIWYTTGTTLKAHEMGHYMMTILETPKAPLYAIMPIGSFLLFVQFSRRTYGYLRIWKRH